VRTRLLNLRVPAGGNERRAAELLLEEGRIAAVLDPGAEAGAEEVVDLGGALVLPGAIDCHVHFDDPGFTEREDFATGTRAAAAGGVTCVCDMPCTSLPPVTDVETLEAKLAVIRPKALVDYMLWGGVSANLLDSRGWACRLEELVAAGVAAIKVYLLSGMETFRDLDADEMRRVLEATGRLGVPVGVHAEDRALVAELTAAARARGGDGPRDYAASRPAEAEVRAVETVIGLCRATGARAHIVHLASGRALDLVTAAREERLLLSAETCPHFLAHTAADFERLGSQLKTAPVVKSAEDRDRLWRGLADGELQLVASDHAAGVWPEEKSTGSIWTDYGGVPGVELMLPYLFSEGVQRGRLTLERLVEVVSTAPAELLGVGHRKGRLQAGLDADLAVLDEQAEWTVRAAGLHNKNRYTPLEGWAFTGRVRETWVRGRRVFAGDMNGGEWFAVPPAGRWIRRGVEA
jgi:allantoinase